MRVIRGLMIAAAPLLWTDVLVLSQNCTAEMAACEDDITCATCLNNATMDGSCDRNATDCAGVADYYCCVAGDACSNNTLLVDHINCGIELDSCTLTDVCNYDNTTESTVGEGDVDDTETCSDELAVCQNDTACAGCYNTTTTDGTCDRNATDCAGVADYYCCLAGDACSNNTLLVDYINCEIEVESCTVTDVCNYASPTPSPEGPGETSPPDSNGESSSHTYPWLFRAGIFGGVTAMLWTQQLY